MGQLFPADPIFLGVERDASVGGAGEGVHRGGEEAQWRLTQPERDILEGQRTVGARGAVFPREQEEKEADPRQVHRCTCVLVGGVGH